MFILGMDDKVKPADIGLWLCTHDSSAKEISSSAEAEVVEEAGNSSSPPFSASEEEGVSRSAETNSDAYLADASSLMSSDDSDSKADETDSVDFDLPWRKRKTLLERIKGDEELTPPGLIDMISDAVEAKAKEASTEAASKGEKVSVEAIKEQLVNQVDESKYGYGAIHFIAKGNYKYKTELLVVLAIHGNADLDLTTTNRNQMTALHLATEINDKECIKTLISLGADFNKTDSMGRTPLDFARMIARGGLESTVQMKEFEVGQKMVIGGEMVIEKGLTRTVEITSSFHIESQSITSQQAAAEDESMIDLLTSVGATAGSNKSREDQLLSSLVVAAARHTNSIRELSPEPKEDTTTSSIRENGLGKENYCVSYKLLDSHISERLHDLSHTLTPEESLELVGDMRKREQFRRKYGSRILCLDGGGIRGLVTLSILQEIERKMKKNITEIFDWIVGTSTGGIIALGLCYGPGGGKSVRQLRNLYWAKKNDVFGSTHVLLKKFEMTSKELESTLKEWLGENVYMRRMSETDSTKTPTPRVLIPAVHKKSNVELHFYNDCFHNEYSGELAWKVARYTSANFLYFTEFEGYIDGGVLANNPAEEGLTAIQDHFHERGEKLPISLLVSVGTGVNPSKEIGVVNISRLQVVNVTRWKNLRELLASVMDVMNKRVHSNCECRCREQGIDYFRFNPELDNGVDSGQIQTKVLLSMLWETKKYLHKEKEKMDKLVDLLSKSSFTIPHTE